jgi:predicted cupin superfamily sugar epimerase
MSPDEIIAALGMQPHPEGGHYVQTFRDAAGGQRGHSTAIYFLLKRGERSAWHRVRDAAEVWHFYAGDALALQMAEPDGTGASRHILGPDLAAGQRPQAIVPADWWQAAGTLGDWTLVGCTVAPGFNFAAFEMAAPGWTPSA